MASSCDLGFALLTGLAVAACGEPPDSPGLGAGEKQNAADERFGAHDEPPLDPQSGCSDAAKLVYVVGHHDRALYSFDPARAPTDTKKTGLLDTPGMDAFKKIGTLNCGDDGAAQPMSMAVDRSGTAWINYSNGRIYRASTADASCTDSGYEPEPYWGRVGMGFAMNAGGHGETLYLVGSGSPHGFPMPDVNRGLATLDTTALKATPLGQFSGGFEGAGGELTGSGAGKLFGLLHASGGLSLTELDPTSAAAIGPAVKVPEASAVAFSFWGGDFWFYLASNHTGAPSKVVRYKAATDKSLTTVIENVGFTIVGAGVSTCAPTTPLVH